MACAEGGICVVQSLVEVRIQSEPRPLADLGLGFPQVVKLDRSDGGECRGPHRIIPGQRRGAAIL